MTITGNKAKNFALEIFEGMPDGLEKRVLLKHSEGVVQTCEKLAKDQEIDLESLKIAGWLHDIGRIRSIKCHAKISLEIAEEKFGELNKVIEDCILNHGNSKTPETREGEIIQFADKLSIMNDFELMKMLFSKEKYKKESLKFIKMVSDDFLEVLEKYNWED